MKIKKLLFVFTLLCFFTTSCKKEVDTKKEKATIKKEEVASKIEEASFTISGMTCEIGCAKTIASKLSKKEGIIDAKVVFTDSVANVKFDTSKTNKKDIITFINGIADGETYKSKEVSKKTACNAKYKKQCCTKTSKDLACSDDCDKKCCSKKERKKIACADNCKKECCVKA